MGENNRLNMSEGESGNLSTTADVEFTDADGGLDEVVDRVEAELLPSTEPSGPQLGREELTVLVSDIISNQPAGEKVISFQELMRHARRWLSRHLASQSGIDTLQSSDKQPDQERRGTRRIEGPSKYVLQFVQDLNQHVHDFEHKIVPVWLKIKDTFSPAALQGQSEMLVAQAMTQLRAMVIFELDNFNTDTNWLELFDLKEPLMDRILNSMQAWVRTQIDKEAASKDQQSGSRRPQVAGLFRDSWSLVRDAVRDSKSASVNLGKATG